MGRRTKRALLVAVAAGVGLGLTGTAQANVVTRPDGNDTSGPLDIRSASHGHAGTAVTHTIRTFGTWSRAVVGPGTPNAFLLFVSTDADPAAERVVLVFASASRMVALVLRPNGALVGRASATKPTGRTVRVSIPRARLGSPAGYRWQAFSYFERGSGTCSNGCLDRVPNGSTTVRHDITAPLISFPVPGVPASTTYDVPFSVSDTGGAGLQGWRLEHRLLGTPTWSTVASGTTGGSKTPPHVSEEDADDEFRVVAFDKHGNTTVSPVRLVSVPVDDDALVYTGTWVGTGAAATDFMATRQSSSEVNATATYTFAGDYVAWIAPGDVGPGLATVLVDGVNQGTVDLGLVSGPRRVVFQQSSIPPPPAPGPHTIVIQVAAGTVLVDGIVVR
ncbi:MAG TPA: hypothetical protein VNO56_01600 [Gaiellaceae bacterium]|nr:hypothetical protein [Gaiellaceae bacterium]